MMPQGVEVSKDMVQVRTLDYVKWPMEGWSTNPPNTSYVAFLARNIEVKRRPFIVLDFRGLIRQVKAVVNLNVQEIRPGDKRLFVIYLYDEGPQEVASWGELIFLDGDWRLPPSERYNLKGRWMKFREKHWPRNGRKGAKNGTGT
jgi:hypothetical protein